MFTKLRIKNFKCFRDTGELDIKPLTFLVGPNSSGKSSIIQMLLMLKQTVDDPDMDNPLLTNGNWVELGAYPEFVYKGDIEKDLNVEFLINVKFGFDWERNLITKLDSSKNNNLSLTLFFNYDPETTQIELKKREQKGQQFTENLIKIGDEYEAEFFIEQNNVRKKITKISPIKFFDSFISEEGIDNKYYNTLLGSASSSVKNNFKKLSYIGPLREFPKAFYSTTGKSPRYYIGKKGENAIDILWALKKARNDEGIQNLETKIKRWITEFGFADDIILEPIGDNVGYRALATDTQSKFDVNIINVGFGVSQTLPIIIQSFYSDEDSTNLIEQPEIHLHPKAQSILGDMFIAAIHETSKNFIIETHSEHLLARVRRRIAEGKLSRDDIKIYYFDPTPEGTQIQEVTLNEYGQYEEFPKGFFEEDLNEAFAHMKVISESKAKGANGE